MKRFLRLVRRTLFLLVTLLILAAIVVTNPLPTGPVPTRFPHIARQPDPNRMSAKAPTTLPTHTDARNPFEVDLRHRDLSHLDLADSADDLAWAVFDTATVWPDTAHLPAGFDPARIMELGKDPGLGVRSLHARGITGQGIAVAVIDQPLLVTHKEFAERLQLYEEVGFSMLTRGGVKDSHTTLHGVATASIAAGKTLGVAPQADLYYIATTCIGFPYVGNNALTFTGYAESVRRILEINKTLPEARRIRAISLSIGWTPGQRGYDDIMSAVADAKAQNVLVTSSSLEETYGFRFHGLGRDAAADPNDFAAYHPGKFWEAEFAQAASDPFVAKFLASRLLIPMDNRTTAGPCGNDDYAHYCTAGWSWCTPYLAGVYALACQVDPTMTPDRFWAAALKTGRTTQVDVHGQLRSLGPILDPVAVVDALTPANRPATQPNGSP